MLIYLKGLGRNEDLTLWQLTLKTAMLLSILAEGRLYTFHKLETSKMDTSDIGEKVMCHITGLTKCSKPSRPKKPIFFRAYTEDKLLCLVSCIKEYLHIRAGLVDGKCTHFFHNTWQTTPPNIQGYFDSLAEGGYGMSRY